MRHFHLKRNKYYCPVINVERLWELVPNKVKEEAENRKDGKVPVLDLVRKGYFKVLGKGNIPRKPMIVKARFFSRLAEKKIKGAGGACVLMA